ncbi:hypothetical protein BV22DRAFT_1193926 [Leucogyrophana mollusca]|uniref:Uncharacterized protein n=1 Tax=Leucogyrophana mollusca TaxID=85980 RepID=A0ACB8BQC4_9AGAM|nr:hypothetical protein BV22DRAFT_1193926 [Leucogyrophana mollusca]
MSETHTLPAGLAAGKPLEETVAVVAVPVDTKPEISLPRANTQVPPLLFSPPTLLGRRIRHVLFLLALGISSTNRLREITAPENESQWQDFKSALFSRVGNINVVASLILATTAAFLTTEPGTSIANWLQPMPYVTILAAFCLAFLAVGCGTFLLFVLMDVQANSLRELSHRPWKFTLALTLLALPTLFVGAAGAAGIVGLCGAVWCGDNAVAKAGLTLTVALTAGIVLGFVGTVF